jgi:hypothetical protein
MIDRSDTANALTRAQQYRLDRTQIPAAVHLSTTALTANDDELALGLCNDTVANLETFQLNDTVGDL